MACHMSAKPIGTATAAASNAHDMPPCIAGSRAARLVVKATFLDLVDDADSAPVLRRSSSDSSLCRPAPCAEYRPSSPCTAASSSSSPEDRDEGAQSDEVLRTHTCKGDGKRSIDRQRGPEPGQPRTTLMLRNLPNNYTRAMVLDLLYSSGLGGLYDFVYVPMDFARGCGLGYAFVNLVDGELAYRVCAALEGFSGWSVRSSKICQVAWSEREQGLKALVRRYRNSSIMHVEVPDDFKPCLFFRGRRVPFPPPRKQLRRPNQQA